MPISSGGSIFYPDGMVGLLSLPDRTSTAELDFHTDASGALGFGAVFGIAWFSSVWCAQSSGWSIFTKELYLIFLACLVWAPQWQHKRVLVRSDNMAVVRAIQSGWCREAVAMQMLCVMSMACALTGCCLGAAHIPATSNDRADALSRLQVTPFHRLHPLSLRHPTPIPAITTQPWRSSIADC